MQAKGILNELNFNFNFQPGINLLTDGTFSDKSTLLYLIEELCKNSNYSYCVWDVLSDRNEQANVILVYEGDRYLQDLNNFSPYQTVIVSVEEKPINELVKYTSHKVRLNKNHLIVEEC